MRNILHGTASRGALFMADMGPGNGGGPAGWWPFSRGNQQQRAQPQQRQNNQPPQNNNSQQLPQQNQNQPGDQNTGDQDDDNSDNFETFLNDNKDLWQDKADGNDTGDPEEEERKRKHLETQNAKLRDYIGKLNFGVKIDMAKLSEAIQNNNPEYVNTVFNEALQRGFAKTFDDVTRMITAAEGRIKEFANNIAQTNVSARESELSLFETVPLARNELFKPIAMSLKARFMKKGMDDQKANEAVQKAFKGIRNADPTLLGIDDDDEDLTMPINGRRVTNRNSSQRNGQSGEIDFVELLTGMK